MIMNLMLRLKRKQALQKEMEAFGKKVINNGTTWTTFETK